MTTSRNDIIELIESNRNEISFSDFGDGVSDEWIVKAERQLGISLPETYKWFLRTYGGGDIAGEEVYSIYEKDFKTAVGGDIVYMSMIHAKNGTFGIDKLVLCNNDGDEIFYFATGDPSSTGEYPIYRIDRTEGTDEPYAEDFCEFLKKRISFLCE